MSLDRKQVDISIEDEIKCVRYRRFLPGGQTTSGFRRQPMIQFSDENGAQRTVGVEEVVRIKGGGPDIEFTPEPETKKSPVKKIRRKSQLGTG